MEFIRPEYTSRPLGDGVQKTGVFEHPAGARFLKHGLVFNNHVQLPWLFNKCVKGLLSTLRLVAAGTLIGAYSSP